ncbi:DUF7093 family protein [Natronorarus salvus]|uniref:DUF7093 family protein n=1 Tax=Natronorarus salvus TaxID=3117733 RepID=UPI002F268EA1
MGLRCSLLGHEYGEPEIERSRDERGSEVVITVTEFQRCTHCGAATVISENTEVSTTGETGSWSDEPDGGPVVSTGDPDRASSADRGRERRPDPTSGDDSAPATDSRSRVSHDSGRVRPRERSSRTTSRNDSWSTTANYDPDQDDAEILEDDPEERRPGEWPSHEDERASPEPGATAGRWPETEGEDEGFSVAADEEALVDVEVSGGPNADRGSRERSTDTVVGFERAASAPVSDRPVGSGIAGELVCPACDADRLGDRPSLRVGDICPECHRGYLAER